MADLDLVRRLGGASQGLAIVATTRTDGSVHASLVNAGVLEHPVDATPVVGLVVRGSARKLAHIRCTGRASLTFRDGWQWVSVEGPAQIIGPEDPLAGVDVPTLLRAVFAAAGGTHDDWDEYDRVMAAEGRTAVLVTPARVITN